MTIPNPTIDELTLAPCPFCGGEPIEHHAPWGYQVTCEGCGARPRDNSNANRAERADAIRMWNTRAPDPTLSTLLEQKRKLEEALKAAHVVIDYAAERLWNSHPDARVNLPVYIDVALRRALLSGGGEG